MPRNPKIPAYRLHRASGQAAVVLSGVWHYLGVHGTPESRALYELRVAEWLAAGKRPTVDPHPDITVSTVIEAYRSHAEQVVGPSQMDRIDRVLGVARRLYGATRAAEFRGRALKSVRAELVRAGCCRRYCNQLIGCLKKCWRWALSEELVSAESAQSVLAVAGLRQGETDAGESEPVPPVTLDIVEATLPFCPPLVAEMVRVQLLAGCRPGEVIRLRGSELDRSRPELWVWRPRKHKTAWRGHRRQVFFGPKAIEILDRYLVRQCPLCNVSGRSGWLGFVDGLCGSCATQEHVCGPWPDLVDPEQGYLFSPWQARQERFAAMRKARKTSVQPSQIDRTKANARRKPGERYDRDAYSRAITRACDRAGVTRWCPLQLRHTAATRIAQAYGWEVARIFLGQRSLDVTRIYAEDAIERVQSAIREVG